MRVFLYEKSDSILCKNFDNDTDAEKFVSSSTTRELTESEITAAFGTKWMHAGDAHTVVTGTDITTATVTRNTPSIETFKGDVDAIYDEKVDADLTIDSREILISPLHYNIMTGFASSNMANVEIMLADGTHHIYTEAEFTAMWNKVNDHKHACGVRRRALYAELEAAEDMSAVDLTTGWPTTTYTTV